jgi:3-oxoacid CoA-transferase A subunit
MEDKVAASPDEAVKDIPSRSIIGVSNWTGITATPLYLLDAFWQRVEQEDLGDFSFVTNGPGLQIQQFAFRNIPELDKKVTPEVIQRWIYRKGRVKKIWYTYFHGMLASPEVDSPLKSAGLSGETELEVTPMGLLAEKVTAGGLDIPAFYSPYKRGSGLEEEKEVRYFNDKPYYLEESITLDFALVRAFKADTIGNLTFRGQQEAWASTLAKAARFTIAEVDEIEVAGELDPEIIRVPSIFVDCVVKVPPEPPESMCPRELYEFMYHRHLDWTSFGWKAHQERVRG